MKNKFNTWQHGESVPCVFYITHITQLNKHVKFCDLFEINGNKHSNYMLNLIFVIKVNAENLKSISSLF